MAEMLTQFPNMTKYDLSRFKVKKVMDYLKEKILEKNPQFSSLIWDDFIPEIKTPEINMGTLSYGDGEVLLHLSSDERKRYYRHKDGYRFVYHHIDTAQHWQTFFEGLHGKTFHYDLKDQLLEKIKEAQTSDYVKESIKVDSIHTDDDTVYMFLFANLLTNDESSEATHWNAFSFSNNGLSLYPDFFHSTYQRTSLDFLLKNLVWVKFRKDDIPEDQLISTPEQPRDPILNTHLNDAFAN